MKPLPGLGYPLWDDPGRADPPARQGLPGGLLGMGDSAEEELAWALESARVPHRHVWVENPLKGGYSCATCMADAAELPPALDGSRARGFSGEIRVFTDCVARRHEEIDEAVEYARVQINPDRTAD